MNRANTKILSLWLAILMVAGVFPVQTRALTEPSIRWMEPADVERQAHEAWDGGLSHVRLKSSAADPVGIRRESLKALAGLRLEYDTMTSSAVQVRVSIPRPELIQTDLLLQGQVTGTVADRIYKRFERFFSNKLRVVSFAQQESWGQTISVAARVDLTGLNPQSLSFYMYDSATNTYKSITNPASRVDANGYLRFNTPYAGAIIISDQPLAKRAVPLAPAIQRPIDSGSSSSGGSGGSDRTGGPSRGTATPDYPVTGEDRLNQGLLVLATGSEANGDIQLDWSALQLAGTFDVELSKNGADFTRLATLSEYDDMFGNKTIDTTYTYANAGTDTLYFRILQTSGTETGLSNTVKMVCGADGQYTHEYVDNDNDELPDYIENALGTLTNDPDSDGDGVSDADEVMILGTDPLLPDSDFDGVNDGDEDKDQDGLTNIQELSHGTNPYVADSDGDGLDDYEEIFTHKTNPNSADSDNDGISDFDEIHLTQTDPLNPFTNGGNRLDGDLLFDLSFSADDSTASIRADLSVPGRYASNVTLKLYDGATDSLFSDAVLGYSGNGFLFDIGVPEDFDYTALDATITYTFAANIANIADFKLYRYDYDADLLYLQSNTVTGSNLTATVKLASGGSYMLLDSSVRAGYDIPQPSALASFSLGQSGDTSTTTAAADAASSNKFFSLGESGMVSAAVAPLAPPERTARNMKNGLFRTKDGRNPFAKMTLEQIDQVIGITDQQTKYNDYDGDGINNWQELYFDDKYWDPTGELIYRSDPTKIDTDGDEVDDALDARPLESWNYEKSRLGKILHEAGFLYEAGGNLLYARREANQRSLGFAYLYDEGIAAISSYIICEPIYFVYDDKEWLIEVWKGQYGVETGAEIGVYYRNLGDPRMIDFVKRNQTDLINELIRQIKSKFPKIPDSVVDLLNGAKHVPAADFIKTITKIQKKLDPANTDDKNWLEKQISKLFDGVEMLKYVRNCLTAIVSGMDSKLYQCVPDEDALKMSFMLDNPFHYGGEGTHLFSRDSSTGHWWLTGFKWGNFAREPKDLPMYIEIDFKNKAMRDAFINGYDDVAALNRFKAETPRNRNDYNNDNNHTYGLKALGYNNYDIYDFSPAVSFVVGAPKATQPFITGALKTVVQKNNEQIVKFYNEFIGFLGIDSNNPNDIEAALKKKITYAELSRRLKNYPQLQSIYNVWARIGLGKGHPDEWASQFMIYVYEMYIGPRIVQIVNMAFAVAKQGVK